MRRLAFLRTGREQDGEVGSEGVGVSLLIHSIGFWAVRASTGRDDMVRDVARRKSSRNLLWLVHIC